MKKYKIIQLQLYAVSKNGLLLSTIYNNNKEKLLWKCKENHQWKTAWSNIKNANNWCPYCAGKAKPDIKILQKYAAAKNGLLLSMEYKNNYFKLLWQCKEGHQWKARWYDIKTGHWCPYCAGLNKPHIRELQKYALSKNGLLLSTKYKNCMEKLLWQCSKNHQWEACWNTISSANHWCPYCDKHITENICRTLLEEKITLLLPSVTIYYFDENNNKRWLFLDGYNKEHKIAFEYNGKQHYMYQEFFHTNSKDKFEAQKQRDIIKWKYCLENDITLIVIPYWIEDNKLERYIKDQLIKEEII